MTSGNAWLQVPINWLISNLKRTGGGIHPLDVKSFHIRKTKG